MKERTIELENEIGNIKIFIKDGVEFITQGIKLEDLREILEQREILGTQRVHEADLMKKMGEFSPAFGMVGTLIGLVFMLFGMANSEGGDGGIGSIGPMHGCGIDYYFLDRAC